MATSVLSSRRRVGGGGLTSTVSLIMKSEKEIQKELVGEAKAVAAFQMMVDRGADYATLLAPEKTGDLKASIQSEPVTLTSRNYLRGVIKAGTDHWHFQEYGTGLAGASSPQPDPGIAEGYYHGKSSGHVAQPYLRPTLFWLRTVVGD